MLTVTEEVCVVVGGDGGDAGEFGLLPIGKSDSFAQEKNSRQMVIRRVEFFIAEGLPEFPQFFTAMDFVWC